MQKPLLLAATIAALSGCNTAPPPDQPPADRFLDEQIASSAAAISQSQFRLQQTSAAPIALKTAAPASAPVSTSMQTTVSSAVTVSPAATPVAPSKTVVSPTATTALPAKPTPPALVVASAKAPAPANSGTLVKVLPVTSVPPVVEAKVVTPPKPLPEPWAISSQDATLRRALNKWVQRAGWQLVWDASVDVPINVDAKFAGDFNTAVKHLFQSLSAADVNLSAVLYSGNRVLRVTESGRRAR
jgi:hypothetical protein